MRGQRYTHTHMKSKYVIQITFAPNGKLLLMTYIFEPSFRTAFFFFFNSYLTTNDTPVYEKVIVAHYIKLMKALGRSNTLL